MKEFMYAVGYYPLMQNREDWVKDIETMKQCGIKYVRTAELFNAWDRIEPVENKFDFGFLDDFFDLCHSYGMKIILGTGTASPPYWIHEKYPDVNILNNHGEQYPNHVSYSWACVDHPGFIKSVTEYVSKLVNRYKDHPALFCYQIHNEISLPFMPLQGGDIDLYCYCENSQEKFRQWLKNKYKTIDQVNYAYRWGATNTVYSDFSQITAPKTKCTSWASVTRWLDWRLFWMENLVEFVSFQNQIIKQFDSKHLTSTNIFFLKSQDPLGVITALDQFEMAKAVDVIGYDLYPGSGNKLESSHEFSSMFLSLAKSTAKPLGKEFWLMETESGPIGGWALGPSRTVDGNDLFRNIFEAIGHESRMTLYQGFRQWDFQPIHWGGLVDLDGNHTDLTKAAKKIGEITSNYNHYFGNAKNNDAKVAILISKENAIILNGMDQDAMLLKALKGAYRVFWEMNFDVEFVTPELVKNGYVNRFSMVLAPFMIHVDEELSLGIERYVSQGGIIISSARLGFLGNRGWYNHTVPDQCLSSVFGVKVSQVFANTTCRITYKKKTYDGYWHKELLETAKDTKILARYTDDTPAITINSYKSGKAIYIGTHLDVAYVENQSMLLWDLLSDILAQESIEPSVDVNYSNRQHKEINVNFLSDGYKDMLLITNYTKKNQENFFKNGKKLVEIKLKEKNYLRAFDNLEDTLIEVRNEMCDCTISLEIRKNEVKIISLQKELSDE